MGKQEHRISSHHLNYQIQFCFSNLSLRKHEEHRKTGRKRGENGEKRMENVEKKSGDDPCADPIRGPCARDADATGGRRSSDSAWARTPGRHVIDEYIEFT